MTQARYWEPGSGDRVLCRLCPHGCEIPAGKRGLCGVRENQGGVLASLSWGRLAAMHLDPIEKKPLFHVLPGSQSLSVATQGCNLRCGHCQNHELSQVDASRPIRGNVVLPAAVVAEAQACAAASISFTYSEPTVYLEWALDIARLAREQGLQCVSVTNGYTAEAPMRELAPLLRAANVDLKGMRDSFYQEVCGGRLQPVLDSIALLHRLGVWVEVTTLLIPGLNDDPEELRELARFLVSLSPAIPWHLSRFHPDHRMLDRTPTPPETIKAACRIGQEQGLKFVYSGNLWGDEGESTSCPSCGKMLIERHGFQVRRSLLEQGRCPACQTAIEGVWS